MQTARTTEFTDEEKTAKVLATLPTRSKTSAARGQSPTEHIPPTEYPVRVTD